MRVDGGGLDPSPKAFEAVLSGSIPIIQHYPGDDAYREFPVVFVDDWDVKTITGERLAVWPDKLTPFTSCRNCGQMLCTACPLRTGGEKWSLF